MTAGTPPLFFVGGTFQCGRASSSTHADGRLGRCQVAGRSAPSMTSWSAAGSNGHPELRTGKTAARSPSRKPRRRGGGTVRRCQTAGGCWLFIRMRTCRLLPMPPPCRGSSTGRRDVPARGPGSPRQMIGTDTVPRTVPVWNRLAGGIGSRLATPLPRSTLCPLREDSTPCSPGSPQRRLSTAR